MTVLDVASYELHLAQERRRRQGGLVQWGSRNRPAVKALQERLSSLGYATEVDGQWGAETERQFRAFQHATGLKTDGKLGPRSLDQLLKSKPKEASVADTGLDAIQKVVAPGAARSARDTAGLGEVKAQQRGGGRAVGRGGRAGGSQAPEGPHGGAIDPATGAETATSKTGPIGITDPTKAHTPRAKPQAVAADGSQRPAEDNNPEFNSKHPREGGRFAAKQGDSGEQVTNTQEALNRTSKSGLEADGQFGPKTDKAVRDFQQKNKLAVDGIVGPKTSGALRRMLHKAKPKPAAKRSPGFQRD